MSSAASANGTSCNSAAQGAALATSFVGLLVCIGPLVVFPFGVFFHPLAAEFGWSRGEYFGTLMAAQIGQVIGGPMHGLLIDRMGISPVLRFSIVALGLSLVSLFWLTPSVLHFYLVFIAQTVLAASASPIGYSRILIALFDRRRGLALGLALSAVGVGAMIFPPLVQWIIDQWGWRIAYLALGMAALLPLPLCHALFRSSPVLRMARERIVEPRGRKSISRTHLRAFVTLGFIFIVLGCVSVGVIAHLVPLLIDTGVNPADAALVASIVGLTVILARAGIGWLIDLVHAPFVLGVVCVGLAAASLLLSAEPAGAGVIVAAILLGLGLGAEIDLLSYLVSRYWRPQNFGSIYGVLFGLFSVGAGLGAWIVGLLHDWDGTYRYALAGATAAGLAAAGLSLVLPRYPMPGTTNQRHEN